MARDSSVSWQEFLTKFEHALLVLAGRVDAFANAIETGAHELAPREQLASPVIEDPGRVAAAESEILVGVGYWATKGEREQDSSVPVAHDGICLQHKAAPSPAGRRYGSLSDFVANGSDAVWSDWCAKISPPCDPSSVLQRFTLVVEDASPDSCFGLISFLARVAGVPPDDIPLDWQDYVRRWEEGDVRTTGKPFASWGALHSALAHSFIAGPHASAAGGKPGERPTHSAAVQVNRNLAFAKAWLACLRFDVAVLRSGAAPHDLSRIRPCPEQLLAAAFMKYEYQQYTQGFMHASLLQLLLPMTGADTRFKLVDAHIEDEQLPLGAKKVFLRNDREHAWLRDGFGLMGVNKPAEKGSGNDMTVSVDPGAGVHLEHLWYELERMEDEKWVKSGEVRPTSIPRLGIKGYPEGRRRDGTPSPNQPWYDEGGRYTLIGAPKALDGYPEGSRLEWSEVLDATWRLYNPLRFLKVLSLDGTQFKVEELAGSKPTPPGKRLVIALWVKESPEQQSLLLSPTVKRCFAACGARQEGHVGPLSLAELPDEASFDFLLLPGGLATVHRDGVFLLNDWRNEDLNTKELRSEFDRVEKRLDGVDKVQPRLDALAREIEALIDDPGRSGRPELQILGELSKQKILIQRLLAETAPHTKDPAVLGFREVLERRWGVASKLEAFQHAVEQLETTLRNYSELLTNQSELKTNRIIKNLTIYGFPAVLLASFFQFITTGFPAEWHIGDEVWPLTLAGVNWLGLIIYAVLVAVGTSLLKREIGKSQKGANESARTEDSY